MPKLFMFKEQLFEKTLEFPVARRSATTMLPVTEKGYLLYSITFKYKNMEVPT